MQNHQKRIFIIVGTRPNFIKITRFKSVASQYFSNIEIQIVHTGQHFDEKMADIFFSQLQLYPDYFLNIQPGNPNQQIAEIIHKLNSLISRNNTPDMLMAVGDVNSTLAAALFANKANIPLIHLESGLRSGDRTMPEEINRIITDDITDYFFVTEQSGINNLLKEGKDNNRIFLVGNTMIDTLVAFQPQIQASTVLSDLSLQPDEYVLMTMHRPATVDHSEGLNKLLKIIDRITQNSKLVFPVHPRTLKNMEQLGFTDSFKSNTGVITVPPLDYFAFQKLISSSRFVITDSGGIQEETTFVQKPCLTLRPNTERPITVTQGTNTLIPFDLEYVNKYIEQIEQGKYKKGTVPPLWDGATTQRILEILNRI